MDPAQLEAILGLWMWALVSDERLVSKDDFGPKSSRAEDIRCMRIISAGVDDSNWDREADKQGEMDLWLGSNAVKLLKLSLTLAEQSCHGIATLFPDGKDDRELVPLDSECESSPMRLCGWQSIYGRPIPITSDSGSASCQQESRLVKLRVQVTPAGGSLLDLCVQELFASLTMSLMGILKVESTTIVENAGSIKLKNPTVAAFAEAFTERGLGSYSEALLCLVPAFRSTSRLPSPEDMLPALLQAAEAYRKASEWDKAQTILRWACSQYAPSRSGAENSVIAPSTPDSPFTRALRATGELYRWSLAVQNSSSERKEFGKSGIEWMVETYRSALPSEEVTEILGCYETLAQRIPLASAGKNALPEIRKVASGLVQAIQEKDRKEALYHLCFIKTGDFGFEPLPLALPLAVRNDWSEVVDAVLEMKASLNSYDEHRRTALFYCAKSGREKYVKLLVDLGAFLDQPDNKQQTPLSVASQFGHQKVVGVLLDTGQVNIEATDKERYTPLSWAAAGGHEAVVRLLLEKGADTEAKGSNSRTPLLWAAAGGYEAVVRLLQLKVQTRLFPSIVLPFLSSFII